MSNSSNSFSNRPSSELQPRVPYKDTQERPPSNVRGKQGDPVSAYRLIKGVIFACLENRPLEDGYIAVFHMFNLLHDHLNALLSKNYNSLDILSEAQQNEREALENQIQEILDTVNTAKSNFDNLKKSNEFIDENKKNALDRLFDIGKDNTEFIAYLSNMNITIETLKDSVIVNIYYAMQKKLEEIINIITDTYLTIRNKLPRTSYPQEGNVPPPPGEGSRIKTAAKRIYELASVIDEHKIEDEKFFFGIQKYRRIF